MQLRPRWRFDGDIVGGRWRGWGDGRRGLGLRGRVDVASVTLAAPARRRTPAGCRCRSQTIGLDAKDVVFIGTEGISVSGARGDGRVVDKAVGSAPSGPMSSCRLRWWPGRWLPGSRRCGSRARAGRAPPAPRARRRAGEHQRHARWCRRRLHHGDRRDWCGGSGLLFRIICLTAAGTASSCARSFTVSSAKRASNWRVVLDSARVVHLLVPQASLFIGQLLQIAPPRACASRGHRRSGRPGPGRGLHHDLIKRLGDPGLIRWGGVLAGLDGLEGLDVAVDLNRRRSREHLVQMIPHANTSDWGVTDSPPALDSCTRTCPWYAVPVLYVDSRPSRCRSPPRSRSRCSRRSS